jgi:hypothetical protein
MGGILSINKKLNFMGIYTVYNAIVHFRQGICNRERREYLLLLPLKMMDEQRMILEDILLHDEDFPSCYRDMAHPNDYKVTTDVVREFIYHHKRNRHDRLIVRACWKVGDKKYVPMSFVCDTGAPSHLYLSPTAIEILENHRLIRQGELEIPYIELMIRPGQSFKAAFEETPSIHKNANIIGLKALKRLELHLSNESFFFNKSFEHF